LDVKENMKNNKRIISLVGREIAGYHSNLQRGFDALEVDNYFFYERTHPFYRHEKPKMMIERWITSLNDIIVNPTRKFWQKLTLFIVLYPIVFVLKVLLFPWFLCRYDVFIFSANYSYLGGYVDRFILNLLNKTTVDIALGSEARPPYLNGGWVGKSTRRIRFDTYIKKKKIEKKVKYTTYLVDTPTTSQFNTRPYIPFLYMGLPFHCVDSDEKANVSEKPLILHAPSNPRIKGTNIIREVIQEIQSEGELEFEYKELQGMPHSEVLNQLKRCSFVINELYSDTLMAGLDTEAAWFGKPSIIGGYSFAMIEDSLSGVDVPPTYRIKPSRVELKKAVIYLLSNPDECKKIGAEAQLFVKHNWSSKTVAQKYVDLVSGKIDKKLFRDPYEDFDFHGCGVLAEDRQNMVGELVGKFGEKSLCLENKPKLKEKLLKDCGLS
jgi:hypothetical protein